MDLYSLLFPPTREEREKKLSDFAQAAIMVDISPAVKTRRGNVNLIVSSPSGPQLIEEINKDWCFCGKIADLTDEEFEDVFSAAQRHAEKLLSATGK